MCGIVGYFGDKEPKNILLSGLRKLEYRGYDSAGIAVLDNNEFKVFRAAGKLTNLEEKVKNIKVGGKIGIGHTRWATHGIPSEQNAHPHKVSGISIVQNGIIENYAELKRELIRDGAIFTSETDTEVVTHLLAREVLKQDDLLQAVRSIIPKLRGAYAILAVSENEPDTIVAFKAGPPLLLGVGKNEIFFGSDVQAFVEHTNRVVYLNDFEIVKAVGSQYEIYNLQEQKVNLPIETVDVSVVNSDKKGFKHYMLKEMFEQPRAVANALAPYLDVENKEINYSKLGLEMGPTPTKALDQLNQAKRFYIVACGTSYYAGLYAKYLIEQHAGIPVEVDVASEFRYRDPILEKNSVALFISQSGETADTLAALRLVKEFGLTTISLCNTQRSTIDRESDLHLYMNSGVEVGVASTKAFLSTLAVLNTLAIYLKKIHHSDYIQEEARDIESLLALPSLMEGVLSYDTFFNQASETLKDYRGFLYLGRGHSYPIAMEGALKLKELAYLHAEGYAAGEMKHGPLALIDNKIIIVVICPKDKYYEKTISNLEEAKARGGVIISIGTGDDEELKSISEHYLSIPESNWMTSGLLSVIPVQLLAYHLADALNHDVDQPRNLAKSVTVE
jgi:glutamine---fructose-6-phosphate transaminase (isomerizing)